jgi:hypothetical protein
MAAFFKKLGSKISKGVSGFVDQVESAATAKLLVKYPDINDVVDLLTEMRDTYDKSKC